MAQLEQLFPFSQSDGMLEFPHLHNVVCGIRPLNLKAQLENPKHRLELESRDKKGNTALYWAATRGDDESVSHLLLAGADVNARSLNHGSPLIASGRAPTPRCIELLLQGGADVNAANSDGFSALHAVAQFQTDPAYMRPLLIAGGNIDIVTKRNFTPLMVAVFEKHPKMCEFLVQQGANLNISSLVGHSPVFEAIRRHSNECLELLLRAGADTTRVAKDGSSILHHAARYGNIETLKILAGGDVDVDHTAVDKKGHTARHYAVTREKSTPGFIKAFNALEDVVLSSGAEYFEALEVQSTLDEGELALTPETVIWGRLLWSSKLYTRIVQGSVCLFVICSFVSMLSSKNYGHFP
jgi:ankyrin repeat protein